MLLPFSIRAPVWKELFIRLLCIFFVALVRFCMCPSFPFGNEGRMLDAIVLIPDHCVSVYFSVSKFVFLRY